MPRAVASRQGRKEPSTKSDLAVLVDADRDAERIEVESRLAGVVRAEGDVADRGAGLVGADRDLRAPLAGDHEVIAAHRHVPDLDLEAPPAVDARRESGVGVAGDEGAERMGDAAGRAPIDAEDLGPARARVEIHARELDRDGGVGPDRRRIEGQAARAARGVDRAQRRAVHEDVVGAGIDSLERDEKRLLAADRQASHEAATRRERSQRRELGRSVCRMRRVRQHEHLDAARVHHGQVLAARILRRVDDVAADGSGAARVRDQARHGDAIERHPVRLVRGEAGDLDVERSQDRGEDRLDAARAAAAAHRHERRAEVVRRGGREGGGASEAGDREQGGESDQTGGTGDRHGPPWRNAVQRHTGASAVPSLGSALAARRRLDAQARGSSAVRNGTQGYDIATRPRLAMRCAQARTPHSPISAASQRATSRKRAVSAWIASRPAAES